MIIVHVLTRLLPAGAEENTLEIARAQRDEGHRVIILYGRAHDQGLAARAGREFEAVCLKDLVHPISPLYDVRALQVMRRLFRRLRPDVVHTHQSKAGILGRIAARIENVPVIVHGVHILPWTKIGLVETAIYLNAERFCARFTSAFVDVSPSVREECLRRGLGTPEQHFVALSPMDIERYARASPPDDWKEITAAASPLDKPLTVLTIGAFEPRKRQKAYVEALAALPVFPPAIVLFAGDGPLLTRCGETTQALGWGDRVKLLGYRSDPEKLIALADVCVLTSEREGLPRVVIQYLAGGRAIIATKLPSLKDVLRDGENAVIVDDVPAAAQATLDLLLDAPRRARLAAGARATDVSAWSIGAQYPQVKAAYAYAFGRRGAKGAGQDPGDAP